MLEGRKRSPGQSVSGKTIFAHPMTFIKDHVGRVHSLPELSQGQELEHRTSFEWSYRRARVAGHKEKNVPGYKEKYEAVVILQNQERNNVASITYVRQAELDKEEHFVRRVGWLRRNLRTIKNYSYE